MSWQSTIPATWAPLVYLEHQMLPPWFLIARLALHLAPCWLYMQRSTPAPPRLDVGVCATPQPPQPLVSLSVLGLPGRRAAMRL
mmetsp:Transcript_20553/g.55366  ORF Transcript_20553/g.55366 Transcript_20553/m.55366 type:complete len:84 (+) Transcript_20553:670-921(+)